MNLTARQRAALDAIVDTICPDQEGFPSARELGVVDALLGAIDANPRASEKQQLKLLLSGWNTKLLGLIGGAGPKRFNDLPRAEREAVLLKWAESRLPQQRAVFHALRKGALLFYYMVPGPQGARNPVWDTIGYDGPLGRLVNAKPKTLTITPITTDTNLSADVVIVGSGAGGGPAAGVLAKAGLEVIVVESGGYHDDEDFDGTELKAITTYYTAAPAATVDQSVGLVAGHGLGGGTVVNYSTSFRTPDEVRAEWAGTGVPAFTEQTYTDSLDAVCDRLGVSQEYNDPSSRDRKLQEGCVALGWHVDAMPRGVRQCAQGRECGYCGLGCRVGAKQSVVKTWLQDAYEEGTKLVVDTKVERVLVEAGAARGIVGRTSAGHRVMIRARAVIVACGSIQTPALLKRSGLRNPNVGAHLHLHPVGVMLGVFDEELKPWEGVMQALYSDQFRDLDGTGYGAKLETGAAHPHLIVPFLPWRGGRQHADLMTAFSNTMAIGVLVRDRDGGQVKIGRDGEPIVHYALSDYDRGHLRTGLAGAAEVLAAAGATKIFSGQNRPATFVPGQSSRESFLRDLDAGGLGASQITLGSFHIMGSARMGGSSATSACDPTGQTWEVRDLYVFDGSSFPSASGVNPQISIQAIAHMGARGLAERLASSRPVAPKVAA